jgi:hypothetical protein
MMFRFPLLIVAILIASTANAQRVFYASSIDIEQNERIDAIDERVERIESDISTIAAQISEIATLARRPVVEVQPKPVVVSPKPATKPATLTAAIKPTPPPVQQSSNYYSQAELIGIVRAAYPTGNYTRYADVSPRSAVWSHLQDGNHRFTAAQVSGLPQDIALGLHGLHHANLIRATRGTSKISVPVAQAQPIQQVQAPTPQQFSQQMGGCANGQCPNPARAQQATQQRFGIFGLRRR